MALGLCLSDAECLVGHDWRVFKKSEKALTDGSRVVETGEVGTIYSDPRTVLLMTQESGTP